MKMSFYKMFNILNIEIYTFIGGIGVKGSFEGLYTFLEVAEIYGIDDSCLRKQVARDKFVIGEDVKKMGRTWIITEQAMIKSFGALKFEEYKKKQQKKEHAKDKKLNDIHLHSGSNAQNISNGVYSNSGLNTQKTSKCSGQKRNRFSKKVHSMNDKEEKIRDSWVNGDIKGVELKNFSFNTKDSE